MTRISLGDMAQSHMLSRQQSVIKAALQRASTELTTGKVDDPGLVLRGDFRGLAGIDATLGRLEGYRATTADASMSATALQTALGKIAAHADGLGAALLTASSSESRSQIDSAGRQSREDLRAIIGTLNTRFSDRSLFAGVATATAPLPDADTWLQSLQASLGPVTTAADLVTAVDAWFAAPAGFAATYLGGTGLAPVDIAPGETADLDIRANDPAMRDTLRAVALSALLDTGVLTGNLAERARLARHSAEALLTTAADRTSLAARVGTAEAKIDAASTRNAAEVTSLGLARLSLIAADPYEAATRLEAAETQLKSIYSVTARLSRLSLVDYI
jgi:flagellar hook-associated protein 3 FlgL